MRVSQDSTSPSVTQMVTTSRRSATAALGSAGVWTDTEGKSWGPGGAVQQTVVRRRAARATISPPQDKCWRAAFSAQLYANPTECTGRGGGTGRLTPSMLEKVV